MASDEAMYGAFRCEMCSQPLNLQPLRIGAQDEGEDDKFEDLVRQTGEEAQSEVGQQLDAVLSDNPLAESFIVLVKSNETKPQTKRNKKLSFGSIGSSNINLSGRNASSTHSGNIAVSTVRQASRHGRAASDGRLASSPLSTVPLTTSTSNPPLSTAKIDSHNDIRLPISPQLPHDVFSLLSENTGTDFPLCDECVDAAFANLRSQIDTVNEESEMLQQYLDSQNSQPASSALETHDPDEEDRLRRIVEDLEKQHTELQREKKLLQDEARELDDLEESYWQEVNEFCYEYARFKDEKSRLSELQSCSLKRLEYLKKANVYNDAFHIWHDGPFGTINGLRLGKLPGQPVEWNEINAAWGLAVQLLHLLSIKMKVTFSQYKLVPLGSFSRIEKVGEEKAVYELYGTGDIQISRLFWTRRFDHAMAAFLTCLNELGTVAMSKDVNFSFPYIIIKDKIGDISIKLRDDGTEWTKACKYVLTNMKWLLAHICQREATIRSS